MPIVSPITATWQACRQAPEKKFGRRIFFLGGGGGEGRGPWHGQAERLCEMCVAVGVYSSPCRMHDSRWVSINPFLPDCKTTFSRIFTFFYAIFKLLRPEHDCYGKFTSVLHKEALKIKTTHLFKIINLGAKNCPVGRNGLRWSTVDG